MLKTSRLLLKSGKLLSAHCTRTLFFIIQRVEFYAVINKNQQFTSLDLSSSTEWKRNLEVRNSCLFNIYKSSVGSDHFGNSQVADTVEPRYFELG